MAEQMSQEEWLEYMQNKLFEIIDNSNNLYDIFEKQGKNDENVVKIHQKTDKFAKISKDEILYVADCLSNLIFATPLYEDFFYVHKNDCREMLFFTNDDERKDYSNKNNNCKFVYLRFRDLLTIQDYFDLDLLTVILTNYVLSFSKENIESFYNIVAYENINSDSDFIIGQPSESYEKAISLIIPKLKEFEEIKNIWLYHTMELKKKNTVVVDNKYEELYDIFVVEMTEKNYITIRDFINKIVLETNNHKVKVALHNSDFGLFLLNTKQDPIYSKE